MIMKRFNYTDLKGKKTTRIVHPIGIIDDKMFCVDLSEYTAEEREEFMYVLDSIHKQYISAIKEVGLSSNFRNFFIDKMTEVEILKK